MLNPACPYCSGTGSIPVDVVSGPPVHRRCKCLLQAEIIANTERGMKGLSKAGRVKTSPLLKRTEKNLWITAPKNWMLPHLRHVALRQPPSWHFQVITDADMMTAWLATKAIDGLDILDADVRMHAASVSMAKLTLVDLIDPPDLLIICLGVKSARNQAMPEVFLEALAHREHAGDKFTWVWDQPNTPLSPGHLCHSTGVEEFLSDWPHLHSRNLTASTPSTSRSPTPDLVLEVMGSPEEAPKGSPRPGALPVRQRVPLFRTEGDSE